MRWIVVLNTALSFGIILTTEASELATQTGENVRNTPKTSVNRNSFFGNLAKCLPKLAKYIASLFPFDIGYYLYTPRNPMDRYNLEPTKASLANSPFDSKLETKIIIHGYKVHLPAQSVFYDIKDELLLVGNYNVFVVNWTKYNHGFYPFASVKAVITGLEVANLIEYLMENTGVKAESLHIIGHSLGAHVAGFVGKTTLDIGRISGLDAAGPIFQWLPTAFRLFHTDAIFVDAIHTDGNPNPFEGYGILQPYGDIDFFPNGGTRQPGCDSNDEFRYPSNEAAYANTAKKKISCNHDRAPFLFLESIRQCNFLSVLCDGYDNIRKGECLPQGQCPSEGSVTVSMGFHARPLPSLPPESTFFLRTRGHPPYCTNCDKKN